MIVCKNCGTLAGDKFCGNCGQATHISRITWASFTKESTESLFQVNRGFFYTLKSLFFKPGQSIKAYLNGQRKDHFKPISYLLTLSTLYFLLSYATGHNTWMDDLIVGFSNGASDDSEEIPSIIIWFSNHYAYTTLLLIPVFSLASYLTFFRYRKNYLEHIVLNFYITGHQAIFYSCFSLIGVFFPYAILESLPLFSAMGYTFIVFWQFFDKGSRLLNITLSLLTYLLYFIFSFGILSIILTIKGGV